MDLVGLRKALGLSSKVNVPEWLQLGILEHLSGAAETAPSVEAAFKQVPPALLNKVIEKCQDRPYACGKPEMDDMLDVYTFYYLPWYFQKVYLPLFGLITRLAFPRRLSILDIGCGPGSMSIGTLEFFKTLGRFTGKTYELRFTLVDQSLDAMDIAENLLRRSTATVPPAMARVNNITHVEANLREGLNYSPKTPFDLILVGHLFNPGEDLDRDTILELLDWMRSNLADAGSVIIVEPGTSQAADVLNWVRGCAAGLGLTVFSPCGKLWNGPALSDCKCYAAVEVPWAEPEMFCLAYDLGLPKRARTAFSYVVLRKDGQVKYDPGCFEDQKAIPLDDLERHVNTCVSVRGIVYSRVKKDRYIGFGLCDGTVGGNYCLAILYDNVDCPGADRFRGCLGGEALELKHVWCEDATSENTRYVLTLRPKSIVKVL